MDKIIITGPNSSNVHIILNDKEISGITYLKYYMEAKYVLPEVEIKFQLIRLKDQRDYSKNKDIFEIEHDNVIMNNYDMPVECKIRYNGKMIGALKEVYLEVDAELDKYMLYLCPNKDFVEEVRKLNLPDWVGILERN